MKFKSWKQTRRNTKAGYRSSIDDDVEAFKSGLISNSIRDVAYLTESNKYRRALDWALINAGDNAQIPPANRRQSDDDEEMAIKHLEAGSSSKPDTIRSKTETQKRMVKGKDGVERSQVTTYESKSRNHSLSQQSRKTASMIISSPKQVKGFFSKAVDSKNMTWVVAVARNTVNMLLNLRNEKKATFMDKIPLPGNSEKHDKQRAFNELLYLVGAWAGKKVDTVVNEDSEPVDQIPESMVDGLLYRR